MFKHENHLKKCNTGQFAKRNISVTEYLLIICLFWQLNRIKELVKISMVRKIITHTCAFFKKLICPSGVSWLHAVLLRPPGALMCLNSAGVNSFLCALHCGMLGVPFPPFSSFTLLALIVHLLDHLFLVGNRFSSQGSTGRQCSCVGTRMKVYFNPLS